MPCQSRLSLYPLSQEAGFTLVEMVVVVALIAILAAIAYPSYQSSVIKSNRSSAQQFMLDVANKEEQYRVNTRSYGTLTDLNIPVPTTVSKYYTVTATPGTTGINNSLPIYTITSVPLASTMQKNDGTLTLDSSGNKTWGNKNTW